MLKFMRKYYTIRLGIHVDDIPFRSDSGDAMSSRRSVDVPFLMRGVNQLRDVI